MEPEQKMDNVEDHEQFLVSVSWDTEADVLESLLNSYKIPVRKKYRETGDYMNVYMGTSVMGVDLYVPSGLHSRATAIIDSRPAPTEVEEAPQEEKISDNYLEKYNNKRRIFKHALLIILFVPSLILAIIAVIKTI